MFKQNTINNHRKKKATCLSQVACRVILFLMPSFIWTNCCQSSSLPGTQALWEQPFLNAKAKADLLSLSLWARLKVLENRGTLVLEVCRRMQLTWARLLSYLPFPPQINQNQQSKEKINTFGVWEQKDWLILVYDACLVSDLKQKKSI